MSAWQTIETAPIQPFNEKEWYSSASPHVLLWTGYCCVIGRYSYTQKGKGRWVCWRGNVTPTHWMPLPGAPGAA